MNKEIKLFTKANPLLGGVNLALREDWGFKIRRVHITDRERDLYLKTFGEIIISQSEFFEWWKSIQVHQ